MKLLRFKKDNDIPGPIPEKIRESKGPKRPRINKTTAAFIIAVVLGLLGVYSANDWIDDRISTMEAEMRAKNEHVKVVVPTRDIAKGERLRAGDMAIREIPIAYIDRSSITPDKFEVAVGQTFIHDVQEGRPVLWAHLRGGKVPTFSGLLPDGKRALTIVVDEINTFSGMLEPKDRIDVLLTISTSGNKKMTMPVLQNVLVLATGKKVRTTTQEDAQMSNAHFTTITVELDDKQAKMMVLAQEEGKITAVLRHPQDQKPGSKSRVTKATLLNAARSRKSSYVPIITGDS